MTPELSRRLEELAEACKKTGRCDDLMVAGMIYTILASTQDRSIGQLFAILSQYSQEQALRRKN